MGGSLASSSTMALSTPQPAKVASTCSTVWTLTLPLARVVERLVSTTFSTRASISGLPSRSTRRKRMPDVRRRRQEGHVHPVAAVQADAGKGRRRREGFAVAPQRGIKGGAHGVGKRGFREAGSGGPEVDAAPVILYSIRAHMKTPPLPRPAVSHPASRLSMNRRIVLIVVLRRPQGSSSQCAVSGPWKLREPWVKASSLPVGSWSRGAPTWASRLPAARHRLLVLAVLGVAAFLFSAQAAPQRLTRAELAGQDPRRLGRTDDRRGLRRADRVQVEWQDRRVGPRPGSPACSRTPSTRTISTSR